MEGTGEGRGWGQGTRNGAGVGWGCGRQCELGAAMKVRWAFGHGVWIAPGVEARSTG